MNNCTLRHSLNPRFSEWLKTQSKEFIEELKNDKPINNLEELRELDEKYNPED